jgi:hypothetical protein
MLVPDVGQADRNDVPITSGVHGAVVAARHPGRGAGVDHQQMDGQRRLFDHASRALTELDPEADALRRAFLLRLNATGRTPLRVLTRNDRFRGVGTCLRVADRARPPTWIDVIGRKHRSQP